MSGMEQEDFVFLEALNQRGTVFLARQRSSGRILVAPKEVFEHPQNQRTREFFSKMHIMAQPEYVI